MDLNNLKAQQGILEEAYNEFKEAVEAIPALHGKWWDGALRPGTQHRGCDTWNNILDCEYVDNMFYIGVEVSCCGSYCYSKYREVPSDTLFNPTPENLAKLLEQYDKDDEAQRLRDAEAKRLKDAKEAEELKQRHLDDMNHYIKKYNLEVGPVGPGTATARFDSLLEKLKQRFPKVYSLRSDILPEDLILEQIDVLIKEHKDLKFRMDGLQK